MDQTDEKSWGHSSEAASMHGKSHLASCSQHRVGEACSQKDGGRTPGLRILKAASSRGMTYVPTVCEAASMTRPVWAARRSETARMVSAATARMLLQSGSSAWPASVSHVGPPEVAPLLDGPFRRTVKGPPKAWCRTFGIHLLADAFAGNNARRQRVSLGQECNASVEHTNCPGACIWSRSS